MGELKSLIEIEAGFPPVPGEPPRSPAEMRLELVPFLRGAQGPSGLAATVTAQEALGGHRAVTADGFHAGPEDADRLVGVTKTAAAIGDTSEIVVRGVMTENSWSWTPDQPIFLGASGVLTQTPSTTGNIRRIAWAMSATTINVDIMPPVVQA